MEKVSREEESEMMVKASSPRISQHLSTDGLLLSVMRFFTRYDGEKIKLCICGHKEYAKETWNRKEHMHKKENPTGQPERNAMFEIFVVPPR